MTDNYCPITVRELEKRFHSLELHRAIRIKRYEPGTILEYHTEEIESGASGKIRLKLEKFAGGGFAGQVYRVRVETVTSLQEIPMSIQPGQVFALKIFVPPSGFSRLFRNIIYALGFQAPFQIQVNRSAAMSGAIWQKFFRRGAGIAFGEKNHVNDIHALVTDHLLGSYGELSDWIDGRTWKLEVDDRLDLLKQFLRKKKFEHRDLGSPEYRSKRKFMKDFVDLIHRMGGHEFARQYEWSTAKSQPNCLKRNDSEEDPEKGLVAVDFRAGLALLPFLPMSPGDIKLILKGLGRMSLVQFDRGNLKKLKGFTDDHPEEFKGVNHLLEQLEEHENIYRSSIPDITHNHLRLLYSRKLWSTMLRSRREAWRLTGILDEKGDQKLSRNRFFLVFYYLMGFLPILGRGIRKLLGHRTWRTHYRRTLTSLSYLKRSFKGKITEKLISWHRSGRTNEQKTMKIQHSPWKYMLHLPLSILPAKIHRFFTDWKFFKEKLKFIFFRPLQLYFNTSQREKWLKDMVLEGEEKNMLTPEDARLIRSQIKEPFIQKYLKSLAVHVCTLPLTQIVSVIVSWIYVRMHPELTTPEAMAAVGAILILFQITPVSPGSLARGFYVVYLVIRERNVKDYNIALILSFFKYIGYLAFPIQMTYRYPTLARFMASHWATEAVHIVPVFGEKGALLEHWVFRLFYNWPLTIRKRMGRIAEFRATIKPRYWHTWILAIVFGGMNRIIDLVYFKQLGTIPPLKIVWLWYTLCFLIGGMLVTRWAGGASLNKRILYSLQFGIQSGIFYALLFPVFFRALPLVPWDLAVDGLWRIFIFTLFSVAGTLIREIRLNEPPSS